MTTDSLIDAPEWLPVLQVIRAIEIAKDSGWDWCKNSTCKYIELRIDMRNDKCLIKDRDGNLIDLQKLLFQYGKESAAAIKAWNTRMGRDDGSSGFDSQTVVDDHGKKVEAGSTPALPARSEISVVSQVKDIIQAWKPGENLHETALAIVALFRTTEPVMGKVSLEKLYNNTVNEHPFFLDALGPTNLRTLLVETLSAVGVHYDK